MEVLVALGLLARINYQDKIQLVFKICDTDNDDCLSFREIYNMCYLIEKVFSKEVSLFEFDSTILLYALADKKAKAKFKWFVKCLKQEKQQDTEEGFTEDWLISYEEFIKSLKDDQDLYNSLLPPPLDLKQVLASNKSEKTYDINEDNVENFLYFRYEMNWLFRKDDLIRKKKPSIGTKINKADELITKIDSSVKPTLEKYRPPGQLPSWKKTKNTDEMKNIENCTPAGFMYKQKFDSSKQQVIYEKVNLDDINLPNIQVPSDILNSKKEDDFVKNQKTNEATYNTRTAELVIDADKKLEEEKKSTKKLEGPSQKYRAAIEQLYQGKPTAKRTETKKKAIGKPNATMIVKKNKKL